jgi:signal peptidase I
MDAAFVPPDALRVELKGELSASGVTCLLQKVGAEGQLAVETVDGGLRVATKSGLAEPARRALALLEARSTKNGYAAVRLGESPPWTVEVTLDVDGAMPALTMQSSPEAVLALHAWWRAAKAEKSVLVPELKQFDLVKKGDTLTLDVTGDGWDDIDKSVAVALAVRRHVFESFKVPSASMLPTLLIGDHFFVDKTGRKPERGDIVVFPFPDNPDQSFVKRIIAQPGDRLEVLDGRPILNGLLLPHCHIGRLTLPAAHAPLEVYVEHLGEHAYLTAYDEPPTPRRCRTDADCHSPAVCRASRCGVLQGPFAASHTEAWVLGDNRNNSHDSRSFDSGAGAGVPLGDIQGRATLRYYNPTSPDRALTSVEEIRLPLSDARATAQLEQCLAARPPPEARTPPAP